MLLNLKRMFNYWVLGARTHWGKIKFLAMIIALIHTSSFFWRRHFFSICFQVPNAESWAGVICQLGDFGVHRKAYQVFMGLWNNHFSFILSALCKDADGLLTSSSTAAHKAQKTVSLDAKSFFLNCNYHFRVQHHVGMAWTVFLYMH